MFHVIIKIKKKIVSTIKFRVVKLLKITHLVYSVFDAKIKLDLRKDVDLELFLYGFEKDTMEYYNKTINKDDIILDIGANIGIYSLIASKKVGDSGKIFAFEPGEMPYKCLTNNIELNNFKNIIPIKSGVSQNSGKANFNICEDDAYNSLGTNPMRKIIKTQTIDLVSIDDFVLANNINKVDVIKVDTEGAEYMVFMGAKKTLIKHKPILFFENNPITTKGFVNTSNDLLQLISSYDYKLYELVNNKLVNINLDSDKIASNIIAICD